MQNFLRPYDLGTNSVFAFFSITLMIIFCSFLINLGLTLQQNMLKASGYSYDQKIILNKLDNITQVLIQESSRKILTPRMVINLKKDIKENIDLLKKNHIEIKKLLNGNNFIEKIALNYFYSDDIENKINDLDPYLEKIDDRSQYIINADFNSLKSGYNFWTPIDSLSNNSSKLSVIISELNYIIYQNTLNQNKLLKILYAILLILALIGLWGIWFLKVNRLNKALEKSYLNLSQKNEILSFQASHDALTLLPNRFVFNKKLQDLIDQSNELLNFSLILLDIDHFKSINDTLGHQTGDALLVEIAQRLIKTVSLLNTSIYRLGGDEFAIIIENSKTKLEIQQYSEYLMSELQQSFIYETHRIFISCSMGIIFNPSQPINSHEVFSAADIALYRVKENGRGHFLFYDDISLVPIRELLKTENELRAAVNNHEFLVYYQPIINLQTRHIEYIEALARWNHPELGIIPPSHWLAIAERLSLVSLITLQVLNKAESDYHAWQAQNLYLERININFTEGLLVNQQALQELNIFSNPKPWMGIEVTESIILDRSFSTIKKHLCHLKKQGVEIFLDDFGTGFANLSHLRELPVDKIKIDRSFTTELLQSKEAQVIVKFIIDLASRLDKKTVCEGVENVETLELLITMGCSYSQGFLHSEPLSFQDMTHLLIKDHHL
jgi:diguanylate cyclase (GGDEF)-like protein